MSIRIRESIYVIITVVLLALIGTVLAHEGRRVGDYELTFGWRTEPALVGYPNGPELYVHVPEAHQDEEHADEPTNPLVGINISLQVEVTFGPATTILNLRRDFLDSSHYIADLIPTRPGDYSFRVFGMIGEMEVDEVFSSADGDFSSVEPANDVTFPDALPSVIDLLERISELEARIQELEAGE